MKKVVITYYPENYDATRNANGGSYLTKEIYERVGDNTFTIRHSTSSDFEFCGVFGEFSRCDSCPQREDDGGCALPFFAVTEAQLIRAIAEARELEAKYNDSQDESLASATVLIE